jgi:lipopolysaccharide transport system permease protein
MTPAREDQGPFSELIDNWSLLKRLVVRDIRARYQGSVFGTLWALGTPLLLLFAYWFVLGEILHAKWGGVPSKLYPVVLFSGLIIHLFGADVLGRAPALIIENGTYVKKVVFPLATLQWMAMATAGFHLLVNLLILLLGQMLISGHIPTTWFLVIIVVLPLVPLLLGLSWFLSSLGTFLRDVQQVIPLLLTLMMFLSPIFFPMELVPERYRYLMYLNPLTLIIMQVRVVTIQGGWPNFIALGIYTVCSIILMYTGYWWFCRTRKGFADVI